MMSKIKVALFFACVGSTSIFFFILNAIVRLITYPFDKRLRLLQLITCFWGSLYTWTIPTWKISTQGREKIKKGTAYMVVSNHQSQLDILAAFNLFFHFKFVSKTEIFRIPLIGWNMRLNQYVELKRGDKDSVRQMMSDCEKRLAEGSSIFFFPEGTRSEDGNIKPFKQGAFVLAHKMKVPILPIVISGTNRALPKYKIDFYKTQKIIIEVLDEIPYENFKNLSIDETIQMVRNILIENLNDLNKYTLID